MKTNNFDLSSTGDNVELYAGYDLSLAQIMYDDFRKYEAIRIPFGRDNAMFLIGDAKKPMFKKSALEKMSKQDICDACIDFGILSALCNIEDYTKAELIEDLLLITIEQYYEIICKQAYWNDLKEKIKHDYFTSHGYSQGDVALIVSIDNPIDKSMREYINRLLWDCPAYIHLIVNDQEFTDEDLLDDIYNYDYENILEKVKSLPISENAKSWIYENLPEHLEYT